LVIVSGDVQVGRGFLVGVFLCGYARLGFPTAQVSYFLLSGVPLSGGGYFSGWWF